MEAAGDPQEEGGGGEGGGQGGQQGGGGGEGHPWLHGVQCGGHLSGRGQGPSPIQGLVKSIKPFHKRPCFKSWLPRANLLFVRLVQSIFTTDILVPFNSIWSNLINSNVTPPFKILNDNLWNVMSDS